MASRKRNARVCGAGLALALAALAGGCGGVIQFQDDKPIKLSHRTAEPAAPKLVAKTKIKQVHLFQDHIAIDDKIQFEFDDSTIKAASHGLLNEIVQVLQDNPQIQQVEIIGHTDAQGSDKHNKQLSEARAAAVRQYLVDHGIAQGRLLSEGKGEAEPLADNATDAGREKNRRVEFKIKKQKASGGKK